MRAGVLIANRSHVACSAGSNCSARAGGVPHAAEINVGVRFTNHPNSLKIATAHSGIGRCAATRKST